ncbi:Cytochrome b-c1 complex subunit 7 [Grifola frondosa]|uniref:Cytochrome b-c1 complex subunit 7 n=1 Tax=Grifola frondosa TaxID=5627 RepID=A0A1C7MFS1_GRIFR|nr:Cytochrome b-c1 complex subunit 7 [Grifola frondosa]
MTIFGPLGLSFAPAVRRSKTLYKKVGLKYDDLIVEERPDVERAVGRLTTREIYDRSYRFKRASQCSVLHEELPKDQWTKPSEDVRYLTPHILDVVKEDAERQAWDTMAVQRK